MTDDPISNELRTRDRELDLWREQWSDVARPSPEFKLEVRKRIKAQDRRFWLGNLLAAAAFVGMVILAVYQLNHLASKLEKGSATGLCVLLFVSVASRLWLMRGTWRTETQSIRAFVELWQRRVAAQIRGLQVGIYLSIGWLVFCAALGAANLQAIRLEFMAHPIACVSLTAIIGIMLPVIWFSVMWFRRRKVAELNEVTRLLEEMETMNEY